MLEWVIVGGLATATLSVLITSARITDPVREWAFGPGPEFGWWGTLFHCHYCMGHWTGLAVTGLMVWNWNPNYFWRELVLLYLAVVMAGSLFGAGLRRLME